MAKIKLDLKPATWEKNRPAEVKGAKLATALKAVDKQSGAEKKGDADAIKSLVESLQTASSAAADVIKKECDKKKHKDLITALKGLSSTVEDEVKRLNKAIEAAAADAGDDEGEVSDDELFGLKLFKECIKKAKLKNNTEDGISFCLAVHKTAEESKLVFVKKKKFSSQIFKQVVKVAKAKPQLGLKRPKMTYGAAYRDPKATDTLVLHIVDGAPTDIPGMVRKLEKWRKRFKQDLLPFKELSIRTPAGKPMEVTPDPDEDAQTATAGATASTEGAAEEQNESKKEPAAPAPQGKGSAKEPAPADRRKEFRKARRQWQTIKEQAIQDLEAVKDGVRDHYMDDPDAYEQVDGKLAMLDGIMENLNDDLRDVLDAYVTTPVSNGVKLNDLSTEATKLVEQYLKFTDKEPLLDALDKEEFAPVKIKAPIQQALKDLVKTLA
ncbi:MAG: hypothetical protein AAGJ46_08845 [Planctomycetota bacterium]